MTSRDDLADEFKILIGNYIDEYLYPIYLESNPLFSAIIKKGKIILFKSYDSSNKLIQECHDNLYKHKQLISDRDQNFFLNKKIKIFPKVPNDFTISFRSMWSEDSEYELSEDEKNMSWAWFDQFLEIIDEWKETEE